MFLNCSLPSHLICLVTMSYCKVRNCTMPMTHTTIGHICSTCNQRGHGPSECKSEELKTYIRFYWNEELPAYLHCTVANCGKAKNHTNEYHKCNLCGCKDHSSVSHTMYSGSYPAPVTVVGTPTPVMVCTPAPYPGPIMVGTPAPYPGPIMVGTPAPYPGPILTYRGRPIPELHLPPTAPMRARIPSKYYLPYM